MNQLVASFGSGVDDVRSSPAGKLWLGLGVLLLTALVGPSLVKSAKSLLRPFKRKARRSIRRSYGRLAYRSNPRVRKGKRKGQPWSGQYGTGFQARYSSRSYRKRHNRRSRR